MEDAFENTERRTFFDGDTNEELIIDKDYVSFVYSEAKNDKLTPKIRQRLIPVSQFKEAFRRKYLVNSQTPILPDNCKYFRQYAGGEKLIIIEEKPQVRTISVDYSMEAEVERLKNTGKLEEYGFENFLAKNHRPYRFHLSFPYILYFLVLDFDNDVLTTHMFYRLSPLNRQNDYLLHTNLLNVGSTDNLCFGDFPKSRTMRETVENVIGAFWTNIFNTDYISRYSMYENVPDIQGFLSWAYNTKVDPMFIFDVKWRVSTNNIKAMKKRIEYNHNLTSGDNINFKSIVTDNPSIEPEDDDRFEGMEENVMDSVVINDWIIDVGDSFKYKNGKDVYINQFDGYEDEALFVQVELWNGKLVRLRLTNSVKDFIAKQLDSRDVVESVELQDGTIVKKDNILNVKFPFNSFRIVEDIRQARDGKTELKLGNDFYLLDGLRASVINKDRIKIGDTVLEPGKEYIIIGGSRRDPAMRLTAQKGKFLEMKVSSDYRSIRFKFVDRSEVYESSDDEYTFSVRTGTHKIIEINKLQQIIEPVFNNSSYFYVTGDSTFRYDRQFIRISKDTYKRFPLASIESLNCIKDNKLHITTQALDIDFEVGDEVVVSRWDHPGESKIIRRIEKIYVSDEDDIGYIKTVTSNGEVYDIPYIYPCTGYVDVARAAIGRVRKIISEFEDLKAGMKIKAATKGISNFPLKDTNMIIGFINDTGTEPLVLCSNGSTLWPFQVRELFDVYEQDTPEWEKLTNVVWEDKPITAQAGDLLQERGSSVKVPQYILTHWYSKTSLQIVSCSNLNEPSEYDVETFSGMRGFERFGFASPRYTARQIEDVIGKRCGVPTLHNSYSQAGLYDLKFPQEEEIPNV